MPRSSRLLLVALFTGFGLFVLAPPKVGHEPTAPTSIASRAARGPELIRRFFEDWHDPFPGPLPTAVQRDLRDAIDDLPTGLHRATSTPWQVYGPFGMTTLPGLNTGRVRDLDVGPNGLRHIAAASGGVWAFDGQNWSPLSDSFDTQWIGSLDTSPVDPDLILAGTGEPWIRPGTGLWRSTDGGTTWQNDPLPGSPATCFRLRFHPDGQSVAGAFDLGIYRSTDAGLTWSRTQLPHWPTDLVRHPTRPDVLWTVVYDHGLFRSDDDGISWQQVQGIGLPTAGNGRGAIAVAASDPERMFVALTTTSSNMLGVFRTDDGGATWTNVSPPDDYFWGQGWYNNAIGVSPLDPDLVLAGGGGLQRSVDGGMNWTTTATPHVHADVHEIEWTPDGSTLYVATDGGVSRSFDDGATYDTDDNRMPITQYVNVAVTTGERFAMGGGSQDNGISVSIDGGTTWLLALGGDGGGIEFDDFSLGRMWVTNGIYGGDLPFRCLRTENYGASWNDINVGIQPPGQWFTRIRSNQERFFFTIFTNNGPWVYFANRNASVWTPMHAVPFPANVRELTVARDEPFDVVIYACLDSDVAGQRLRVYEGGARDGTVPWVERSSGLPAGIKVRKVIPDPSDPDVCFALMNGMGTHGAKVFRSVDRGANWINVTGNLPDLPLADLVPHPNEVGRWYLGTEFGCFRTTDGGVTWESWNEGLADAVIVTEMVLVDRTDDTGEMLVAAGTYGRGLWMRPIPDRVTSVESEPSADPRVWLSRAAPNPARDTTALRFRLSTEGPVRLRVFDVRGRLVTTLVEGTRGIGEHVATLRTASMAPGVYLVRLEAGEDVTTRRITVVR